MPTSSDILVILAGLAGIAWVNWYFFLARRTALAAALAGTSAGAPGEVTITVRGGYSPSIIRAKAGQPLRLVFDRQETSGCSEEIVFPDFGIRRFLPANKQTAIDITPAAPGRYEFMCGMSMLRGELIAEE